MSRVQKFYLGVAAAYATSIICIQAQIPANDNVAAATALTGVSGSVTGPNIGATAETGEPTPVAGNPPQSTIWFTWTAPYTGWFDFTTAGSASTNGNDLLTVMAIYTSVNNKPEFPNFNSVGNASGAPAIVHLDAAQGQLYYIQVDGSNNGGTTNEQGIIALGWGPGLIGGGLGFTSPVLTCSDQDNGIDFQTGDQLGFSLRNEDTVPSWYNAGSSPEIPEVPITLVRTDGAVGRCQVALSITNAWYTNIYITNYVITNVITESQQYDTNNKPIGKPEYTNQIAMVVDSDLLLQNDDHGQLSYLTVFGDAIEYYGTNTSSTQPWVGITNIGQILSLQLNETNYGWIDPTNFPSLPPGGSFTAVGSNSIANSDGTTNWLTFTTNIYHWQSNYITMTPAATPYADYFPTNDTVTFDDFQMSKDYYVQVLSRGSLGFNFGADWPDTNGYYILPDVNGRVLLTMSNPALDPQENPAIQPPSLGPVSSAELNILDMQLNDSPAAYGNNLLPIGLLLSRGQINTDGTPKGGYAVFNFERSVFRFNKDVGPNASVWVYRTGDDSKAYTVHYVVDTDQGHYNTGTLDWDLFNLNPGSDYAVPSNSVPFSPAWDFVSPIPSGSVVGTLTFPAFDDLPQPITFPVINQNGAVEFDQDVYVHLFISCSDAGSANTIPQDDANEGCTVANLDLTHSMAFLGTLTDAHVIINFDNTSKWQQGPNIEPGGAVDRNYNPDGFVYSYPPINLLPGANSTVRAIGLTPTGESVIGGDFSDYDTVPNPGVAKVDTNGLPDLSFDVGNGADGAVEALTVDGAGRIVLAGTFTSFNGTVASRIVRLLSSGAVDTSFQAGIGANGSIWAMTMDSVGRIYIAGDFTSYNVTNRSHVARLNPDGSLDPTYDPGAGTDSTIKAIALDASGNLVIGGAFTYVDGTNWNYIGRLLPTGALDTSFNPGTGCDGNVFAVAVQPNNRIVIGGGFRNYDFVSRPHLARLAPDGSLDTSFVPGSGSDDNIYSIQVQPDGKILIGGSFTQFNGNRRVGLARLLPQGWVDTSFMDTAYNQFAGLVNHYYDTNAIANDDPLAPSNERSVCYAMALQPDGNILVGGSFQRVGGGYLRDDVHYRWNYARVIGTPTVGPQDGLSPTNGNGTGLGNFPGNITFAQTNYSGDAKAGSLFLTLYRTNGSLGPVALTLATNTLAPGSGSATAADFGLNPLFDNGAYPPALLQLGQPIPTTDYGWRLSDGEYGRSSGTQPVGIASAALILELHNDPTVFQNLFANLSLVDVTGFNQLTLGGEPIPFGPALGQPTAQLEIVNDNFHAGVFGYSATNYPVVESGGFVTVSVVRTNGSQGSVTVNYATENGTTNGGYASPAVSGGANPDYAATTGQLQFNAGETLKTFQVQIYDHSTAQPNKFFNVRLFNLTGQNGASFDTNYPLFGIPQVSTVTIVDDHFQPGHLEFNSGTYSVLKGGVAAIPVIRTGGALGNLSVEVVATNVGSSTATPGRDYVASTTNLSWSGGDIAPKIFYVQTLQDSVVEGPKTLGLYLTNPIVQNNPESVSNTSVLGPPNAATLTIQDSDCAGTVNFSALNYNLSLNAGAGTVTVVRTGGTVGTISVNYTTSTNVGIGVTPAAPGVDYTPVSGQLTFFPGVTAQTFTIPISPYHVTNEIAGTNRLIGLVLSSPSGPGIPPTPGTTNCAGDTSTSFPRMAVMTLLDPNLVLSPAGSVDLTTLNGTGFNSVVEALGAQPNGALLAGGDFSVFSSFPFNSIGRIRPDGSPDVTFQFNMTGANGTVWTVLSVPPTSGATNNGVLLGGDFTQLDGDNSEHLGRLNFDGSVDESFNIGSGPDNSVFALAQVLIPSPVAGGAPQVGYVIGGSFASYNGTPISGVARLNSDGSVDPTFNVGAGTTGANPTVRALAVQADGKLLVAGDFTAFNNVGAGHIVRLNEDGTVDTTFMATNTGANDSVRAVLLQPDGRIVIGGLFTNVNGQISPHIARLNTDGSFDTTFNVGAGVDNTVLALAIDTQSRILAAGEFSHDNGVTRNSITRLNPDGSVDPTINFGLGANGFVSSIVIQPNDEIDLAGWFTSFDEIPESGFVRLYGGELTGSGSIEFDHPYYGITQGSTNAVVAMRRIGGTSGQVSVEVYTANTGTASNGVDYLAATNTIVFPSGETFGYFVVPILSNPTVASNTTVNLLMANPVNVAVGPQTEATLFITNRNSAVVFSDSSYRVAENAPGGEALIPVVRIGNIDNEFTVTAIASGGSAIPGINYTPETNTIVFAPGVGTNYFIVPLINDTTMYQDATVNLQLTDAAGANVILSTPSQATLTIASVYQSAGVVSFSSPTYTVDEGAGSAIITLNRANGVSGSVAVTFSTSDGTAHAGVNYGPISTNVTFGDGEFTQTIRVPIYQLTNGQPNTTVNMTLSNPQFGVSIGSPSTAVLTILNNVQNFGFGSGSYFVSEGAGTVTLTVDRNGPTTTAASVYYVTYSPADAYSTNGLAEPGVDYVPVLNANTNVTTNRLTFGVGQTFQTIPIAIKQGNVVKGPSVFYVYLTNNAPSGTTSIGTPNPAAVTIISDVTGFDFATNAYVIGQNGGTLVATVTRINPNTGPATVQYSTSDVTAQAGIDYVAARGTLSFANGQGSTNITVEIVNKKTVTTNRTFNITLSNPSANSYVVPPTNAVVTITNVLSGVAFQSLAYSACKSDAQATITVVRTGLLSNTVTVAYATTSGGTAVAGQHYVPTSGTLTFLPGQTTQSFNVVLINDNIVGPNRTVDLSLTTPTGAQLLNPTAAQLTIQQCTGSDVVAAGTAFISGSSNISTLFPNETVTIAFGLRNISGTNTANLVGTLLPTNGVANVAAPETYGVLVTNGPAVSRNFTFQVVGTNGQNITATMQLQDGSINLGQAIFGFTIGGKTMTFSNAQPIIINDSETPPTMASPYPSAITVNNVVGNLTKVTATLNNFNHSFASDVDVILQGPGPGADSILMAHAGYGQDESHVNLTFDQTAGNPLPETSSFGSGAYLPTAYSNSPVTKVHSLPPPGPSAPYPVTLDAFNGTTASGIWNLWVMDDKALDSGEINGGWTLNLSIGTPVPENADLEVSMSTNSVALTTNNVTSFTVGVTNYGPAGATNVVISDILGAGLRYESNNFNGVTVTNGNGALSFSVPTLAVGSGISFEVFATPTNTGYATNVALATADEPSVNANDAATNTPYVGIPSADVGVAITASINPIGIGQTDSFLIGVTNYGPSQATATEVTYDLPAGLTLVSATAGSGSVTTNGSTITWNVGALNVGNSATMTVTVTATLSGQPLSSVLASSSVYDPAKANNFRQTRIEVTGAPSVAIGLNAGVLNLNWPGTGNYILQGTTSLSPPIVWTSLTSAGATNYTSSGTNNYQFFRLKLVP